MSRSTIVYLSFCIVLVITAVFTVSTAANPAVLLPAEIEYNTYRPENERPNVTSGYQPWNCWDEGLPDPCRRTAFV